MMGQLSSGQERLFYSFNLEDHIPANHLLRSIDRCLDLSDLRHYLADFYSPIGRPSIDPELMIRMLIVGYCYGIRSERRLCEEAHLNLAYRWFCRLSLEDEVPKSVLDGAYPSWNQVWFGPEELKMALSAAALFL
jgi:transposase